jgi:hypothetical protein
MLRNMSCQQCSLLQTRRKIWGLQGLSDAITSAKAAVADGMLSETNAGPMAGTITFAHLDPNGPYDDLLIYNFDCTRCGQQFQLSAETYHGAGGAWGPRAA